MRRTPRPPTSPRFYRVAQHSPVDIDNLAEAVDADLIDGFGDAVTALNRPRFTSEF
jgi:hypothetical protein